MKDKSIREKALDFWNKLDEKDKKLFCNDMYSQRDYNTLTGREIQNIFSNWTPLKAIENLEKSCDENSQSKFIECNKGEEGIIS